MDFHYRGNTAEYNHLIRKPGSTSSDLNFECNLRNYANRTNFNTNKPWMYPDIKKSTPLKSSDKIIS